MSDRIPTWGDPLPTRLGWRFWFFAACWTAAMCGVAILGSWR